MRPRLPPTDPDSAMLLWGALLLAGYAWLALWLSNLPP